MSDLDFLIAKAQAEGREHGPTRGEPSPHELRVLRCLSHGMTIRMAAETLGRNFYTVEWQVKVVRRKLAAKNVAHAVGICFREGWLT